MVPACAATKERESRKNTETSQPRSLGDNSAKSRQIADPLVSDDTLTSSGHLPAWSWTHEPWMRRSSPTISGVSLRGLRKGMILATGIFRLRRHSPMHRAEGRAIRRAVLCGVLAPDQLLAFRVQHKLATNALGLDLTHGSRSIGSLTPAAGRSKSGRCSAPAATGVLRRRKRTPNRRKTRARRTWGFRTMPISVPGHADHPFRDDGDHDSGMMPITRSGMIPIS